MDDDVHKSAYVVCLGQCDGYNDLAFLIAVWQ